MVTNYQVNKDPFQNFDLVVYLKLKNPFFLLATQNHVDMMDLKQFALIWMHLIDPLNILYLSF